MLTGEVLGFPVCACALCPEGQRCMEGAGHEMLLSDSDASARIRPFLFCYGE